MGQTMAPPADLACPDGYVDKRVVMALAAGCALCGALGLARADGGRGRHSRNLKVTGLTHNFPVDPAV